MSKMKIWFGKNLKSGALVKRGSLKGLCSDLKLAYNTVKKKQDKDGGVTLWLADNSALEVWMEEVER